MSSIPFTDWCEQGDNFQRAKLAAGDGSRKISPEAFTTCKEIARVLGLRWKSDVQRAREIICTFGPMLKEVEKIRAVIVL